MTTDGKTVYDSYNDPTSKEAFNGNKKRPAGFGYDYERSVNIVDIPYSHLLALDATPISIADKNGVFTNPESAEDYNEENAAYVHVFVPVMFSIGPSYGDQYAKLKVDWTSLERIEDPDSNLSYKLWAAKQIKQGNSSDVTYDALQSVIKEVTVKMENIWPSQSIEMNGTGVKAQPKLEQKNFTDEETAALVKKLTDAVDSLAPTPDKTALETKISEAKALNRADYTSESYSELEEAIAAAETVNENAGATQTQVDDAAEQLQSAINNLSRAYAAADYTAVDAALAKIPADLSVYTEESVKVVETAKNAVVRGKNETEQAAVDAMAKALNDAIAALERKNEGTGEKENLKDGVYSVQFSMVKMNRGELSMSNDAVNHTAKLVVKNGQYTVYMNFKGLHYLNRFGYLAKLSYYDNGYSYGEYGAVSGMLKKAEVISTQKNADGTDIIDEFNRAGGVFAGNLYPETVSFPLVDTALADTNGYVALHVFVPVMEDISDGTGDQDVLMKIDWNSLRKTTEDDPSFKPEIPEEQSPAIDYSDSSNGVKIHADKGVLAEDTQITVTELANGADYNAAAENLNDEGKKFKLYSVKFSDKDGASVSPNGTVSITFPIPAGYNADKIAVYRLESNGKVLVKGLVGTDGYTVVTKSAGSYALIEIGSTITDSQNTANINNGTTNNPKTGDSSNLAVWGILMLASAGMLIVLTFRRKRRITEGK